MLQINAVKMIVNSDSGIFESEITFKKGLNIIRANNTTGKSSLFGALLYGLGFEELLGGRNEKALQSVFKSTIKAIIGNNGEESESNVLQSEIYLEISNGTQVVTTRRFGKSDKIKPQAVEVFLGPAITSSNKSYERKAMFVHDAGAASNSEIGFHTFLEEFIGTKLPEVINQEGKRVKLYLPLISVAHFIEQKAGWSDYFANIPYYGIRDTGSKVLEYLLNFEVFQVAAQRQEVSNRLRDITESWKLQYDKISSIANRSGGEIVGIPQTPEIMQRTVRPYLRFHRGDRHFLIDELVTARTNELKEIEETINAPLNMNLDKVQQNLTLAKEQVERYEVLYESLNAEIGQDRERYREYSNQLKNVNDDVRKNKNAEKIEKLGLESNLKISLGFCPTCNQVIEDSLLSEHVHAIPMRIDENLAYLEAQKKMIVAFLNNLKEEFHQRAAKLASIEHAIGEGRRRIRLLRRDLVSDDRLPSEEIIERKIVAERELNFLYKLRTEINDAFEQIYLISDEFTKAKGSQSNLPKEYHSAKDREKLLLFENSYKYLLTTFGYSTRPVQIIKISPENYLPGYEIKLENSVSKHVDIRFESSASDFIRSQWAYYTALMKTSKEVNGNHFNLLVFDEPQQQSAATVNFKSFLEQLEGLVFGQSIVFASFQNSDKDFRDATKDLKSSKILDFTKNKGMAIKKVSPAS